MARVLALLLASGALGAAAVACGPSFQAIYEGNARFEHCYALEENPQSPMHDKAECWHDWSEHYTYGQTRDRIQYAIARYVALSQTENIPTDEAMMNAAPGVTPRVSVITAPAPTNAFAPPPKVLGEMDASTSPGVRPSERPQLITNEPQPDAGARRGPSPSAPPPGQSCADACKIDFDACETACSSDAGPGAGAGAGDAGTADKNGKCPKCSKAYKSCMRGCFK